MKKLYFAMTTCSARGGTFYHTGSCKGARRAEPLSVCGEPADVVGSAGTE